MIKAARRKQDLVIVGGGGLGREVLWLAQDSAERWNVIGVLDDAEDLRRQTLCSIPVLGPVADWKKHAQANFVIAIGAPRARRAVEAKMVAQQKAIEEQNRTVQIQQQANQTVITAKAAAESMTIRAQALEQNPKLVEWEAVQKWNGVLPVYSLAGAVPFINVPTK